MINYFNKNNYSLENLLILYLILYICILSDHLPKKIIILLNYSISKLLIVSSILFYANTNIILSLFLFQRFPISYSTGVSNLS